MTPAYTTRLGLVIKTTNMNIKKIDGLLLKTYREGIVGFSLKYGLEKMRFFKETFLLAETSIEIVLEIFFSFSAMQIYSLIFED